MSVPIRTALPRPHEFRSAAPSAGPMRPVGPGAGVILLLALRRLGADAGAAVHGPHTVRPGAAQFLAQQVAGWL